MNQRKTAALLSLLLALVAFSNAQTEVLQNPEFDSCPTGTGTPIGIWTGGSGFSYAYSSFTTDVGSVSGDACFTKASPASGTLSQSPTIVAGNYDFEMLVGCRETDTAGTCIFSLTIDGNVITLTGPPPLTASTGVTPVAALYTASGFTLTGSGPTPVQITASFTGGNNEAIFAYAKLTTSLPVVTIVADTTNVAEDAGLDVTFTLSRTGDTASPLSVDVDLSGGTATYSSDYTTTPASTLNAATVSFAANSDTATLLVTPAVNPSTTVDVTVVASVSNTATYAAGSISSGTVTIVNTNPLSTITIALDVTSLRENSDSFAAFTITRTGSTFADFNVDIILSGSANPGLGSDYDTDYGLTKGSNTIIIPAGFDSAVITVIPLLDNIIEGAESISISIDQNAAYIVGSPGDATLMITNEASAVGDPHFKGFSGQVYDFIGEPDTTYNILSDPFFQVNTFLGIQQSSARTWIDGPVMKQISASTPDHAVLIDCGGLLKEEIGSVSVDGQLVLYGQSVSFDDGLEVSFRSLDAISKDLGLKGNDHVVASARVTLKGKYFFEIFFIENVGNPLRPDLHVESNYHRRFLDFNAALLDFSLTPHGILGQTAHIADKSRSIKKWRMEGTDEDYVVQDGLFGSQFTFNQFQ